MGADRTFQGCYAFARLSNLRPVWHALAVSFIFCARGQWLALFAYLSAACLACAANPPPNTASASLDEPKAAPAEVEAGDAKPAMGAPAPLPFRLPCEEHDAVGCAKGCEENQMEDCVTLAAMYLKGDGVPKDQGRAIDTFRRSCEKGSARACIRLGDVYREGILHDETEEAICYRKACEAGANTGCVEAGRAFVEGKGVMVDAPFGALLFGRACERGNMWGCYELAHLYERGEGVVKNEERAREMFLKACHLGLDQGCLAAGPAGEVAPPRN